MLAFFNSSVAFVGRFDFAKPHLLLGRVWLSTDHLTLTGWNWKGRYRRCIPLHRLLHVDAEGEDLILWLFDGETLHLRTAQAVAWKAVLSATPDSEIIPKTKDQTGFSSQYAYTDGPESVERRKAE